MRIWTNPCTLATTTSPGYLHERCRIHQLAGPNCVTNLSRTYCVFLRVIIHKCCSIQLIHALVYPQDGCHVCASNSWLHRSSYWTMSPRWSKVAEIPSRAPRVEAPITSRQWSSCRFTIHMFIAHGGVGI